MNKLTQSVLTVAATILFGELFAQGAEPISLEKMILNTKYAAGHKFMGVTLEFKTERYSFTYGSEGRYWHNSGTFKIESKRVTLAPKVCNENASPESPRIDCKETFGVGYCEIDDKPDDIEFSLFLACHSSNSKRLGWAEKGIFFPIQGSERKAGSIIRLNGVEVEVLLYQKAIITDTANIRNGPTIRSTTAHYFPKDESKGEILGSIPAGTKITILGRTVAKEKVSKWENHWYLISVGHNHRAWVFGQFIKAVE